MKADVVLRCVVRRELPTGCLQQKFGSKVKLDLSMTERERIDPIQTSPAPNFESTMYR